MLAWMITPRHADGTGRSACATQGRRRAAEKFDIIECQHPWHGARVQFFPHEDLTNGVTNPSQDYDFGYFENPWPGGRCADPAIPGDVLIAQAGRPGNSTQAAK